MPSHDAPATTEQKVKDALAHAFRFHAPFKHLNPVFGENWFAMKAEAFARFFGTPFFLIAQTAVVVSWIAINATGLTRFDVYPFILLNLAFSLQAAYAAPLILLAQTRQADRDKAHAEADAQHREAIAAIAEQRQVVAAQQTSQLVELLQQNTKLAPSPSFTRSISSVSKSRAAAAVPIPVLTRSTMGGCVSFEIFALGTPLIPP